MKLCIKEMVFNFSPFFTDMSLFDTLPNFRVSPLFSLQFLQNSIHGLGIKKRVYTCIPVFSRRVLGLSYAPLKFSVEKKVLSLLLLDWSMDFPEIKYMYVNTNRYEDGH